MPATLWTKTNPRWLVKQLVMATVFAGFGIWGYVDAAIIYPARGAQFAEYQRFRYLDQIKQSVTTSWPDVSIADPVAALPRARESAERDAVSKIKAEWLESLSVIGRLNPASTTIADPAKDHAELQPKFSSATGQASIPKKLESYDIPVQWLIFGVCSVIAAVMYAFAVVVSRTRYGWDPDTKELTLPSGETLRIEDVEDFDRRKWEKFLMFVRIVPAHPTLGGRELKLDLLRSEPLERWVVEMEHTRFPGRAESEVAAVDPAIAPGAEPQ